MINHCTCSTRFHLVLSAPYPDSLGGEEPVAGDSRTRRRKAGALWAAAMASGIRRVRGRNGLRARDAAHGHTAVVAVIYLRLGCLHRCRSCSCCSSGCSGCSGWCCSASPSAPPSAALRFSFAILLCSSLFRSSSLEPTVGRLCSISILISFCTLFDVFVLLLSASCLLA